MCATSASVSTIARDCARRPIGSWAIGKSARGNECTACTVCFGGSPHEAPCHQDCGTGGSLSERRHRRQGFPSSAPQPPFGSHLRLLSTPSAQMWRSHWTSCGLGSSSTPRATMSWPGSIWRSPPQCSRWTRVRCAGSRGQQEGEAGSLSALSSSAGALRHVPLPAVPRSAPCCYDPCPQPNLCAPRSPHRRGATHRPARTQAGAWRGVPSLSLSRFAIMPQTTNLSRSLRPRRAPPPATRRVPAGRFRSNSLPPLPTAPPKWAHALRATCAKPRPRSAPRIKSPGTICSPLPCPNRWRKCCRPLHAPLRAREATLKPCTISTLPGTLPW